MNDKLNNSKTPMAKRGLRRSERIIHFATKVTPEFDNLIREQAEKEGLLLVEILERYQKAYLEKLEREKKKKR